ncbi:ribbon-helix-helix protein, CopG family [Paramicrobacterium humi]|uniref:ribbon-helix-helix protein, CopG family n=1 Tax=Paramicrobacterium humi TaxID=640635 RepID=UPI001FDF0126|nr:ribbon-helix-helix protein, CopG family [Microbacterium humi]
MAINVRLPEALDRKLEQLAAAEHVSKHALLLQGAELVVQRHARRIAVDEAIDDVLDRDAALLERLADA